jgi:SAM-dependent methyltransferase
MGERAIVLAPEPRPPFRLACPRCRGPLAQTDGQARCPACALRFVRSEGIWRLLPPEREFVLRRFVAEYRRVRSREGWGSPGPDYYLSLPFLDLTGRFQETWSIRASSFRTFVARVLQPLERGRTRPLVVLDLGAGNGWLSHRLAERGHAVAAVDLCDDPRDGLLAGAHFPTRFTCVLADFDHLPFAGDQADLVVFNASLHYSPDAAATLAEAFRVLHPEGVVAVVDTPMYRNPASGARMLGETRQRLLEEHGVASPGPQGEGFLSGRRLRELTRRLGTRARVMHPPHFWPMRLRALAAEARGGRETATFPVVVVSHPEAARSGRARRHGGDRAAR